MSTKILLHAGTSGMTKMRISYIDSSAYVYSQPVPIYQILNRDEFKHLMFPPDIEKISQFVSLCTTIASTIAPPVAILGLTYFFLKRLSDSVSCNMSEAQRVLIVYTADLTLVLEELSKFALQMELSGKITWTEFKEAFEFYQRSKQNRVHRDIRVLVDQQGQPNLKLSVIQRGVKSLIDQHRQLHCAARFSLHSQDKSHKMVAEYSSRDDEGRGRFGGVGAIRIAVFSAKSSLFLLLHFDSTEVSDVPSPETQVDAAFDPTVTATKAQAPAFSLLQSEVPSRRTSNSPSCKRSSQ
ncbi:hypothetical protein B0H13DRAFT_1926647 [Mycena leptocephala]|nr:hypothetical protein B0H13DRAFT_1926647 [Mycena leptocephala]